MRLYCRCNALFLTVSALSVVGAPVTRNLSGVTFGEGGTASGSFVFDSSTNTYSSINITTTSGSTLTGTTYNGLSGYIRAAEFFSSDLSHQLQRPPEQRIEIIRALRCPSFRNRRLRRRARRPEIHQR
jgi:hypothetical protein